SPFTRSEFNPPSLGALSLEVKSACLNASFDTGRAQPPVFKDWHGTTPSDGTNTNYRPLALMEAFARSRRGLFLLPLNLNLDSVRDISISNFSNYFYYSVIQGGPRKSSPPSISSRRLTLNWRRSIPFHPVCRSCNMWSEAPAGYRRRDTFLWATLYYKILDGARE
ncbi:unnamed protein product, partial [Timema podura]|nr:unnamed protein product [Timema podura]